jgi:arsenite methyltransferase
VVRRGIVLAALNLRTGERVLELGCGGGYLAREVAQYVGQEGRVCAIDISPDQIAAAQARCADLSWVECRTGDITAPPYADSEFDASLPFRRSNISPTSTARYTISIACCTRAGGSSS